MKTLKIAALGLGLCLASASFANDCAEPLAPSIPDGASASMDEMLTSQKAIKTFQTANLDYMACLEPMIEAAQEAIDAGDKAATDRKIEFEEMYNAAVSQEEDLAGEFNTQIREYKAANSK